MALDIGSQTVKLITEIILESNMILWNGPLGAFEYRPFDYGTNIIAETIYGIPFASILSNGNIIGTQFHPEKSQGVGVQFLQNFMEWRP